MSDSTADEPTTQTDISVDSTTTTSSPSPAPAPASEPAPAPVPVPAPAPPIYTPSMATVLAADPVSLDDFMQNLSRADNRVSLVNAFALNARLNALHRATPDDFQAAYVAFCNAPA